MRSENGIGPGGADFDPTELSNAEDESENGPRSAPAPGLPISEEEYKRLKEAAKQTTPASSKQKRKAPTKKRKNKPGPPHR